MNATRSHHTNQETRTMDANIDYQPCSGGASRDAVGEAL